MITNPKHARRHYGGEEDDRAPIFSKQDEAEVGGTSPPRPVTEYFLCQKCGKPTKTPKTRPDLVMQVTCELCAQKERLPQPQQRPSDLCANGGCSNPTKKRTALNVDDEPYCESHRRINKFTRLVIDALVNNDEDSLQRAQRMLRNHCFGKVRFYSDNEEDRRGLEVFIAGWLSEKLEPFYDTTASEILDAHRGVDSYDFTINYFLWRRASLADARNEAAKRVRRSEIDASRGDDSEVRSDVGDTFNLMREVHNPAVEEEIRKHLEPKEAGALIAVLSEISPDDLEGRYIQNTQNIIGASQNVKERQARNIHKKMKKASAEHARLAQVLFLVDLLQNLREGAARRGWVESGAIRHNGVWVSGTVSTDEDKKERAYKLKKTHE